MQDDGLAQPAAAPPASSGASFRPAGHGAIRISLTRGDTAPQADLALSARTILPSAREQPSDSGSGSGRGARGQDHYVTAARESWAMTRATAANRATGPRAVSSVAGRLARSGRPTALTRRAR